MLKKTITYTDFDGNERTEDHYFNLTEAEIQESNLRTPGGIEAKLKKIVQAKDPDELVSYFKSFILDAYGVKSEDGRRFIKSDELKTEFSQTGAYNKLFMELTTNTDAAIAFVQGVIPQVPEKETAAENIVTPMTPNA